MEEELKIIVTKLDTCAKVSLFHKGNLLASEDVQPSNILISNMLLSHIRGTIANLVTEVLVKES